GPIRRHSRRTYGMLAQPPSRRAPRGPAPEPAMSSEGSYPHSPPEPDEDDLPRPEGALVLDFPSDEVSSPGVPAGTWADDGRPPGAAESTERLLRPAAPRGGQVVAFPRSATTQKRLRPVVAATVDARLRDASGPQKTQPPRPSEEPGP